MIEPSASRYGSRKWLAFLLVAAQTAVLCWFKRIDGLTYSTVIVAAIASYFAANVYQKKAEPKP
jgi:amino acid permease